MIRTDISVRGASERAKTKPLRVLVLHPFTASFIESDIDLLRRFCVVETMRVTKRSQYPEMVARIFDADVVFSWFALGYALVAALASRVQGRGSVIVAGGWDVLGVRELGYGRLLSAKNILEAKLALAASDRVLAFSEWSRDAILAIAPHARVETAYLGVDASRFLPRKKEKLVVSVANVTRENVRRKGLQAFARASQLLPETNFVLIGRHVDDAVETLRAEASANMAFLGWVSDEELRETLGRAKVYVQASFTEGFGVALAEAMASGCVPVVTHAGAIPEVVGDTGIYVQYDDVEGLAAAIRIALESGMGDAARTRVVERFGLDRRFHQLFATLTTIGLRAGEPTAKRVRRTSRRPPR